MKETKTFAQRLRQIRTQRGITQKELAQRIGMKAVTVSSYENEEVGKGATPSLDNAVAIARELNVSLDYPSGIESARVSTWEGKTEFFLKALTMIHEVFPSGVRISEYENAATTLELKEGCSYIVFEQPDIREFFKEWEAVWALRENNTLDEVTYKMFVRCLTEKYVPSIIGANLSV